MTNPQSKLKDSEAEARAFFTCGDATEEARWDALTDQERAGYVRAHANLLSVRLERFQRDHPLAHHFLSGEWAVALLEAMYVRPLRALWRRLR